MLRISHQFFLWGGGWAGVSWAAELTAATVLHGKWRKNDKHESHDLDHQLLSERPWQQHYLNFYVSTINTHESVMVSYLPWFHCPWMWCIHRGCDHSEMMTASECATWKIKYCLTLGDSISELQLSNSHLTLITVFVWWSLCYLLKSGGKVEKANSYIVKCFSFLQCYLQFTVSVTCFD